MLLRPLYKIENFQKLISEVMNIIDLVNFENNQIMCQSLESNPNDWKLGTGSIDNLEEKDEKQYSYINDSLQNTYLKDIITKHRAYRTRIITLPPRQCYSIHRDYTKRIHIPIVTNDQCWMIWPKHNACYQMPVGLAYLTDTTIEHTFINSGSEKRIHIVMCIEN